MIFLVSSLLSYLGRVLYVGSLICLCPFRFSLKIFSSSIRVNLMSSRHRGPATFAPSFYRYNPGYILVRWNATRTIRSDGLFSFSFLQILNFLWVVVAGWKFQALATCWICPKFSSWRSSHVTMISHGLPWVNMLASPFGSFVMYWDSTDVQSSVLIPRTAFAINYGHSKFTASWIYFPFTVLLLSRSVLYLFSLFVWYSLFE